jgi:hypothetical protein
MTARRIALCSLLPALVACRPDLEDSGSLVTSPRILAVRGDPPESSPGRGARYQALVAGRVPDRPETPIDWWFCDAPKPLTEDDVVGSPCLQGGPSDAQHTPIAIGAGTTITATTPLESCQRFGPDPPPGMFRPRDPDVTGGYYQPIVLARGGEHAIALERVTCNLARAPSEVAATYRAEYVPNRNPKIAAVRAKVQGAATEFGELSAHAHVEIEVEWTADSKESFLVYDLSSAAVVTHRESLTVSWFADSGSFAVARTGRGELDDEVTSANLWTAPSAGDTTLWIVLRDSRGGVDFLVQSARIR